MLTGNVRARCASCGTVELRAGDVTILPCLATIENVYRFRCPHCTTWVINDATPRIVLLLLRAGVRLAQWDDPLAVNDRPVALITEDEVFEFRLQLERLPTAEG